MPGEANKLSFIVGHPGTVDNFRLNVYRRSSAPHQIEITAKGGRTFYKKSVPSPPLNLQSLFVGSTITVLGRVWTILRCADSETSSRFKGRELAAIRMPAHDLSSVGRVIDLLTTSGLALVRMASARASPRAPLEVVAEFTGPQACTVVSLDEPDLAGCAVLSEAETAEAFGASLGSTAQFRQDCTLAVVKPHALAENQAGAIIDALGEHGLQLTALRMVHLDADSAEKFLASYRDVLDAYSPTVQQFASGPCIAMELVHPSGRAQEALFEACGPFDVAIAKKIRPGSVRARFGENKVLNAVHCTDLPAPDGQLESRFFFDVLGVRFGKSTKK